MNTTTPIRAAIYTRVSTLGQADGTSLDEQKRVCAAEIARKGWELTETFTDEGQSGTSAERPEWNRMLTAAKDGKLDAVVVSALDRFSRKVIHGIAEMDTLETLGVVMVVVKESIDLSTHNGRLLRNILLSVAESERDRIVERTVQGQRAKGRNGQWPGGQPPFGWKLAGEDRTAHPVPNDREREIIRTAYDLLVKKRLSGGQVADRLNDAGMLTRQAQRKIDKPTEKNDNLRSNNWNPDVLRRTLANATLHTGKVIWGAAESGSVYKRSHHTKLDRNGKPVYGDPIELTLPEPPLTTSQHNAIMRALARRSTRGLAQAPVTQLLSSRLSGECGAHYIGVSLANKDYDVYRCSGRKHLKGADKCQCKQVQAQAIDGRVWEEVTKLLGDPARLEAMARRWLEVPDEADDSTEEAMTGIDRQITKLERGRSNATRELLLADNPDPIREALADIEHELGELKNRRAAYALLKASSTDKAQKLTDIARLAERAAGRLASMPPAQRREIVELLDVRVFMGGGIEKSEPAHITITGQIDPRLFDDGSESTSAEDVGPRPSFPEVGHKPSNSVVGDDGGGRVRRAARGDHAQRRRARHAHRPRAACPHLRGLSAGPGIRCGL